MTPAQKWLALAAGPTVHAMTDAQLLQAANVARHQGDDLSANVFLATLSARADSAELAAEQS